MPNDGKETNTKQTGVPSRYASVTAHLHYELEQELVRHTQRRTVRVITDKNQRNHEEKSTKSPVSVRHVHICLFPGCMRTGGLFLHDTSQLSLSPPVNQP